MKPPETMSVEENTVGRNTYMYRNGVWSTLDRTGSETSIIGDKRRKNRKCTNFQIAVIVLLALLILAASAIPIYLHLSSEPEPKSIVAASNDTVQVAEEVTEEVKSTLELLMDHKRDLEALVNTWKTDYGTSNTIEQITQHGFLMHEVILKMAEMRNESLTELQSSMPKQDMFREIFGDVCPAMTSCSSIVTSSPYRTLDGSCNNLMNPEWGIAGMSYRRDLPPSYADGFGVPRKYGMDGKILPSPRKVSNMVHKAVTVKDTDTKTTVMVMAFGQFLSHDVVSTPQTDGPHSTKYKCCQESVYQSLGPFKACFNINIEDYDEFFKTTNCMRFTRSAPAMCSNCEICGREQVNEASSYIDASNVYGSTETRLKKLRKFRNGLLLVNEENNMLPWQPVPTCKNGRQEFCFAAGDARVNVVPNLAVLHLIFVRLHNLLAMELSKINVDWTDERLFQEARKIVSAIMQNIVYSEYLPVVLGPETMDFYNLGIDNETDFNMVHDLNTNAGASNAFATAAFRFGHATIPDEQIALNVEYKLQQESHIEDTFNNPDMTLNASSGVARWMVNDEGDVNDGSFVEGVRSLLFLDREMHRSFDLVSLNIQRGRDHGLPSYNEWRRFCRFPVITSAQFRLRNTAMGDFTPTVADKFRDAYRHEDDIDLFSGGIKETRMDGAEVGPTFACILGDNFRRFKVGDRFYFENPYRLTGFSRDQLKSIKSLKFAKVICKTMNISIIPTNVFIPCVSGEMVDCDDLDHIDMSLWADVNN